MSSRPTQKLSLPPLLPQHTNQQTGGPRTPPTQKAHPGKALGDYCPTSGLSLRKCYLHKSIWAPVPELGPLVWLRVNHIPKPGNVMFHPHDAYIFHLCGLVRLLIGAGIIQFHMSSIHQVLIIKAFFPLLFLREGEKSSN